MGAIHLRLLFRSIDSSQREFTCGLLSVLSRHIRRTIPSLLTHPPLLAHTIYQALAFDASLQEDGFSLSGTLSGRYDADAEWKGISDVILGRKEWFDIWVEGEKACEHWCWLYTHYRSLTHSHI